MMYLSNMITYYFDHPSFHLWSSNFAQADCSSSAFLTGGLQNVQISNRLNDSGSFEPQNAFNLHENYLVLSVVGPQDCFKCSLQSCMPFRVLLRAASMPCSVALAHLLLLSQTSSHRDADFARTIGTLACARRIMSL